MLAEKKTQTNIGVGVGIVLQIAGRVLANHGAAAALLGLILVIVGAVFFIWGCMNYAEGKGHSKWVGLVGLASCLGLLILIVLPDHHKEN